MHLHTLPIFMACATCAAVACSCAAPSRPRAEPVSAAASPPAATTRAPLNGGDSGLWSEAKQAATPAEKPAAPVGAPATRPAPSATPTPPKTKGGFVQAGKPDVQPPLRSVDLSKLTGGVVDEAAVRRAIHVATGDVRASDANDGSAAHPLKTFGAAYDRARALLEKGTPVRIRLARGTYREGGFEIRFPDHEVARATTLVIEGEAPGAVEFSGSDVFSSWKDEGDGVWSHDWPHRFGFHAGLMGQHNVKELLGQRREMVFVDGAWQHPVILEDHTYVLRKLAKTQKKEGQHGGGRAYHNRGWWTYKGFKRPHDVLFPGSFGVTERDENGRKVYLRLAQGVDPNRARVEVTCRRQWARIAYKDNVVLRNLVFEQYASPYFPEEGWQRQCAVQLGHPGKPGFFQNHNVVVEDVETRWNSGGAFAFNKTQGLTVRRLHSHHNGTGGAGLGDVHNMIWEDVTTNFNNWRGVLGKKYGWAMGGTKFHQFRTARITNHTAIGNKCAGIWMDVNCENFVVERAVSIRNSLGVFFEISKGPMELRDSLLADNGKGIQLLCAEHVTLKNNIVYEPGTDDPKAKIVFDQNVGKRWRDVKSAVRFHFYNRASHKSSAQWDVFGTELFGRPKTHNDFWLPGPALAEGNVFVAGDNKYSMFMNIWLPPHIRQAELFTHAWRGRGNHYHATNTDGFLFVDFNQPEKSPKRLAAMSLDAWGARFDERDATWGNPRFVDPTRYDFRLHPDSPVAHLADDLPGTKLPVGTLRELKQWDTFVAGLVPGRGWK